MMLGSILNMAGNDDRQNDQRDNGQSKGGLTGHFAFCTLSAAVVFVRANLADPFVFFRFFGLLFRIG